MNPYLIRRIVRLCLSVGLILFVIFRGHKRSSAITVFWCLVFALNPYVGLVLYLIFGSTTPIRLAARRHRVRLYERGYRMLYDRVADRPMGLMDGELSPMAESLAKFNYNYCHAPISRYGSQRIYTDGASHYRQLFEDIERAEETVHVLFYEVENDYVGKEFMDMLADKAKEGVEVLFMTDAMTGRLHVAKFARRLRKNGGKVRLVRMNLTHFRNHRKIVVVDHRIAWIGGMNIGKRFQNEDKVKTPWRDTQIRLTGDAADELDACFFIDWFCNIPISWLEQADRSAEHLLAHLPEEGDKPCQFITGGPASTHETVKMTYLSMITAARSSIQIQSPYFIPDESMFDALRCAAASGVRVEIMVPGVPPNTFLEAANRYYCGRIMLCGAHVYRYHGYLHAKTMTVDGEACAIGSANMDYRSLFLDDEITGVFYGTEVPEAYTQQFAVDRRHCTEADSQEFLHRTRGERLKQAFCRVFEYLY